MSQSYLPPSGSNPSVGAYPRAQAVPEIPYLCADCGKQNAIKMKEPIRCQECGCRVMYKKRVKRMVQFEAR